MPLRGRIYGPGFRAEVDQRGQRDFRFVFAAKRAVIAHGDGEEVLVHGSDLRGLTEPQREALLDTFWELARPLGFRAVFVSARAGDPHETYQVRP